MNSLKIINPSQLTLWLPFQEGSGTTAADRSGNGNTGTLVGSPTWVDGKIGKALQFNGSTQNVTLANAATLSPGSGDFTILALVKPESHGVIKYIYWDSADTDNAPSIQLYHLSTDYFGFVFRDGDPSAPTGGNQVSFNDTVATVNEWVLVAACRIGTTGYLYSSHVSTALLRGSNTNAALGTLTTSSGRIPRIGGAASGADVLDAPFKGIINYVQFWKGYGITEKHFAMLVNSKNQVIGG